MKKSTITIEVTTDENNVPTAIDWQASDAQAQSAAKAIMLSVFDKNDDNTLRMDLWTKDFTTDEMKQFFHQTLLTMSDTLERSTGEKKMALQMRDFCDYFAEHLNLKGG